MQKSLISYLFVFELLLVELPRGTSGSKKNFDPESRVSIYIFPPPSLAFLRHGRAKDDLRGIEITGLPATRSEARGRETPAPSSPPTLRQVPSECAY